MENNSCHACEGHHEPKSKKDIKLPLKYFYSSEMNSSIYFDSNNRNKGERVLFASPVRSSNPVAPYPNILSNPAGQS